MGAQQNAAARCGGCAGVGRARRKDGGVPRRARRGLLPGRRGQGAVSGDATGASGARRAGAFLPGGGGKPGTGGLGRVRRTKAAWRAHGRTAQRGRYTVAFRGRRGEGAAVYGGRDGYNRGRRASYRDAAGGGAGKTAAPSAARVGFQATSAIEAAGGRKSPFLPYKEALFPGARRLSNQSCFAPESLLLRSGCFFGGAE